MVSLSSQAKRYTAEKRAFTLVELLMAIAIFAIVMTVISGIFISGIRQQKIALLNQTLADQASFSLEYMGRALRMAKKELSAPACLSQNGLNYEITRSGSGLKFINVLENNDCQEFFLEAGQLKYRQKIGQSGETLLDLTSNKLEITSLKFNLTGESQNDDLQPRLTIFLEARGRELLEDSPKIKIQTTISQRNPDVLQ